MAHTSSRARCFLLFSALCPLLRPGLLSFVFHAFVGGRRAPQHRCESRLRECPVGYSGTRERDMNTARSGNGDNHANQLYPNNPELKTGKGRAFVKPPLAAASNDNRANRLNPNNPEFKTGKGRASVKPPPAAASNDNRANQLNPNNPECKAGKGRAFVKPPSAAASNDNRANKLNPNNPNFQMGKGRAVVKCSPTAASNDNRANQRNPNNPECFRSKGMDVPPKSLLPIISQSIARKKRAEGVFENVANRLAPRDRVSASAVQDFSLCLRKFCGGDSKIRLKGSRLKRVAIKGSDFDYQRH
ncbi:unnamed protein product [Prorocentrum cordatum]|uniref:Uncharacterized protein n=1 Tax=Prorocentrum cordatum TaxID=2364126 RepID=A0ABN9RY64_9DINO|nr:unnamed protein product [Polarella glacialis]